VLLLFWLFFVGMLLTLSLWYRHGLIASDPHSVAMWLGTSYLTAFAVTELYRRMSVLPALLCACVVLLLWNDLSRHGTLMMESRNPLLYVLGPLFGSHACVFQDAFLACFGVQVLIPYEHWIFAALFAVLVLIAAMRVVEMRAAARAKT
jgi:hypothetical protein